MDEDDAVDLALHGIGGRDEKAQIKTGERQHDGQFGAGADEMSGEAVAQRGRGKTPPAGELRRVLRGGRAVFVHAAIIADFCLKSGYIYFF